jgi:hypothetical protein
VYVPAAVTVAGFAAFTNDPPFHTMVFPAEVPVRVTLGLVHVIVPLAAVVTVGSVPVMVTVTVAVAVQPFVASVAVQV